MGSLNRIYDSWRYVMDTKSDPRTTDWFMMSSPLPTMAISATYICLMKFIGPRLMANRKPFSPKLQLYYNIFHLVLNIYLFYEASVTGWLTGYSFRCQSVDFARVGMPLRMARGCWLYYLSKFTDFFETVIFVLLKRFEMVNLYHLAHHSIMPVSVWWGVKFLAGGHSTFFGFINTAVHIVIYSYFVTITVWPKSRRYFSWWKAFYPFFQIGQFAMIFLHAFQLVWNNDCNYPMAFVYFIGGHAALFYLLVRNKMRNDKQKKLLESVRDTDLKKHDKEDQFNSTKALENDYKALRHRSQI